jgi:hypothetical protein
LSENGKKRKKKKKSHHGQARAAIEFHQQGKAQVAKVSECLLTN